MILVSEETKNKWPEFSSAAFDACREISMLTIYKQLGQELPVITLSSKRTREPADYKIVLNHEHAAINDSDYLVEKEVDQVVFIVTEILSEHLLGLCKKRSKNAQKIIRNTISECSSLPQNAFQGIGSGLLQLLKTGTDILQLLKEADRLDFDFFIQDLSKISDDDGILFFYYKNSLQAVGVSSKKIEKSTLQDLNFFLVLCGLIQFRDQLPSNYTFYEDLLGQISTPCLILNASQDIIFQNSSFLQLGLLTKELFLALEYRSCRIDDTLFQIEYYPVAVGEDKFSIYLFYKSQRKINESFSSKELGIISSSIAHELNNPIAGILSAITVLELEDLDEESMITLGEMRNSALKCRDLVKVFLGFGRANTDNALMDHLKSAIESANNLIRFRGIESKIALRLELGEGDMSGTLYNLPLLTMFLYLLLNDLLTQISHYNLLLSSGEKIREFTVECFENCEAIHFVLPEDIKYREISTSEKLIQSLLMSLGMTVEMSGLEVCLTKSV